jgi:molybdopterin molybdotransferase
MLTWKEAMASTLAETPIGPSQRVRIDDAVGRVLAGPLIARNDSPPFDMSAMDGFGVHPADVARAGESHPVRLRLAGTIRAGETSRVRLRRGSAVRLLTGASVPPGIGAVVMREYCREGPSFITVGRPVRPGENIRRRGGEFRKGQKVLDAGVRITPPVVGLLAAFGCATVPVYAQPVVTIGVTGDELLAVNEALRRGRIRDSNSYALTAAVQELGIGICRTLRLKDRPALLKRHLADAMAQSDVLLTVGGISVGDYDHVRAVLGELGVREVFWRVAIKPGKPAYFGVWERNAPLKSTRSRRHRPQSCLVFGLPGNPVSALVCFHQLVRPALLRMMGMSTVEPPTIMARLVGDRRKEPGRLEWVRGRISTHDGEPVVEPTPGQDSHMLGGLAQANCLIRFPQSDSHLADGERVAVEPLSWRE